MKNRKYISMWLKLQCKSYKWPFYNVVFIKCLHILSRFEDIRNGKEKIRKQNSKIKALFTFH